ncbi:MAG: 2-amino-4-hydroxy-6-hydroxymethyldihydropteridine diphosphokinase [Verrucomicrobiales bacterium]|nr:2-amino-4-hydroxy-6-hydroxymethyldihydropteridine diphosphokinase [Verrucomicrobiales bacterium]
MIGLASPAVPLSQPAREVVVVALGANLENPVQQVRDTCRRLRHAFPGGFHASSLWSSSPVDCPPGAPPFVNAVTMFDEPPDLAPEALLEQFQRWEREAGRPAIRGLNAPRPLDVDLIVFGRVRQSSPLLTIPHPRAHQRRFVLAPLAEIAPHLHPPGWEYDVATTLERLVSDEILARLGSALTA